MNIKRELGRSAKYDLISFDIFDTLIKRDVINPVDVFYQVGSEVLLNEVDATKFKERRIKAEQDARKKTDNGEVNLIDIYRELFRYYGINTCILKEKEIDFEIHHCTPREKWVNLLKAFKEKGEKVILISDMYLPSSVISQMLVRCGITEYEGLYVSNEYGCDKVSGKLYEIARDQEKMDGCSHLHYGDSVMADYLGARKGGATPRLVFKEKYVAWFLDRIIRKIRRLM